MVIYDYYVASLKPERTASAPLSGHVFILADTFVGKPVSDLCAYHDSHTLGESPVEGKFSLCVSQSITGESSKWTETTEVNFTIHFTKAVRKDGLQRKFKTCLLKETSCEDYFGDQFS